MVSGDRRNLRGRSFGWIASRDIRCGSGANGRREALARDAVYGDWGSGMSVRRGELFGQVLSTIAVACAITVTALVIRRQFAHVAVGAPVGGPPTPVTGWTKLIGSGHRMGSSRAPVTILEFADSECPYCRAFTTGPLRAIRSEFAGDVAVIFRHWPLPYHEFAYPAARAAECAAAQGHLDAFHDALYAQQDSLGLKSFVRLAMEVGIRDTAAFDRCAVASTPVPAIDAHSAAARAMGGTGTPAIVVNGMLLHELPDSARLEALVKSALRKAQHANGGQQ